MSKQTVVVHYKNKYLASAGLSVPECKAGSVIPPGSSTRWVQTTNPDEVTCKNCRKAFITEAV